MIKPTVGRIVDFYQSGSLGKPQAAIVTEVHDDRLVNLCVFTWSGHPGPRPHVALLQDDDKPDGRSEWCAWMPYQKGQAAKYEAEVAKNIPASPSIAPIHPLDLKL
jgi:hypothetical protein